jgi:hypothetical protein
MEALSAAVGLVLASLNLAASGVGWCWDPTYSSSVGKGVALLLRTTHDSVMAPAVAAVPASACMARQLPMQQGPLHGQLQR